MTAIAPSELVWEPVIDLSTSAVVGVEARPDGEVGPVDPHGDTVTLIESALAHRAARADSPSGLLFVDLALETGPRCECRRCSWTVTTGDVLPDLDPGGRVVIEITQHDLLAAPSRVLALRDRIHARGWVLAVDHVGSDPGSLAMLPLLEPEIVKLDPSIVQGRRDDTEAIVDAVTAFATRTGALIVAEGIRTEREVAVARSMGAHLGQGSFFGEPGATLPLAQSTPVARGIVPRQGWLAAQRAPDSPAAVFEHDERNRIGGVQELLDISHDLERRVSSAGEPSTILLAAFQHSSRLGWESADRFRALAGVVTFVGVIGVEMADEPLPGVRGIPISWDDPMRAEWDVVIVTPSFEAALISRELPRIPGEPRRFDFLVSEDGPTVRQAARALLSRFGSRAP